jgi:hypothetical protein
MRGWRNKNCPIIGDRSETVTNDWAVGEKSHPAIPKPSYNNEAQKK